MYIRIFLHDVILNARIYKIFSCLDPSHHCLYPDVDYISSFVYCSASRLSMNQKEVSWLLLPHYFLP